MFPVPIRGLVLIGRSGTPPICLSEQRGNRRVNAPWRVTQIGRGTLGDIVAQGSAFGAEGTATSGIVSAVMRSEIGHRRFEDYSQVDAFKTIGPLWTIVAREIFLASSLASCAGVPALARSNPDRALLEGVPRPASSLLDRFWDRHRKNNATGDNFRRTPPRA